MFIPTATAVNALRYTATTDDISPPLHSLSISTTSNGFNSTTRGWNSFGMQANPSISSWTFDQTHVIEQCDQLVGLDSGWSVGGHGDDNGRIIWDDANFDIPELADHLHGQGLNLGVYVVPGAFLEDVNKIIVGTDIKIGDACSGDNGLGRCNWNYTVDGAQQWHDSVVQQFADWGVDYIKMDYVTPGSPDNGANLPEDETNDVMAYHRAIVKSGRAIRLAISWKLERDERDYGIWASNADAFRTDQDINNSGVDTFVAWSTVQRAIDNYRQYISAHTGADEVLTIYPDLDNMYIGNGPDIDGVSEDERYTIASHWMASGSSLMIGNDLTKLDDTGRNILTNADASSVADFASTYPMRPRNPGTGESNAQQLQAWIAGPAPSGEAIVLLANYGPDEGQGGFDTSLSGLQNVSVSWADLGIAGSFTAKNVWTGTTLGEAVDGVLNATLSEGQTLLVKLTPVD
ncbi:glycoside hydrolase family 27 protein [Cylindrobasidium torrendii FP15055 ss-10]|uniref:alpha-galactosidase n=1 Tax=Cylindrobasidium torrendii FP15055 ss-10 TaxID=1314674 RepID=A0A0D7BQD6_9AGAR|nr:glycoside hydrolase family 27 protein [Cylindrobasidium torrendii FP15055 ss-10]